MGRRAGVPQRSARSWRAGALAAVALVLAGCGVGTWQSNPTPAPARAIHVALLPTGKLLLVAGSGNDSNAFGAGQFRTSIWDPVTNSSTSVSTPWDAFCAGHAQLPDGRLLVAGGTAGYESPLTNNTFAGSRRAYTFDPQTSSYERVANMTTARWYPTLVTLGDGSVLSVAGQGSDGRLTSTSQRFTGAGWTADQQPPVRNDLPSGQRHAWALYPGLHLLDDGRVFYSAAHTFFGTMAPAVWDLTNNTMRAVPGLTDLTRTDHAMSVLLPPAQEQKVMILGGGRHDGSVATGRSAIVDLSQPNPRYADATPLDVGKMYVSAVILPDRTVFETGGSQKGRGDGNSYTYSAQIYDPEAGTWTKAKDSTLPRGYHSSAVLLPDGRVVTFGNNPPDRSFDLRVEIYSPEYLTRGSRPEITSVANQMNYGGSYTMATRQSSPIRDVSLIRPMAVTHSVDANQRLVDVPFTVRGDGRLQLSITGNPNLAPPGWYMLFATDNRGVPSVASWVKIGEPPGEDVAVPGAPQLVDPDLGITPSLPTPGVRGG